MEKKENYVACCGCYCKTCKMFINKSCRGCKLGYDNKKRDINKAKCKIKICCYKDKNLTTCADCVNFQKCSIISNRFKVGSNDNKKCMESLEYIKNNGYDAFIKKAKKWKSYWGKLS